MNEHSPAFLPDSILRALLAIAIAAVACLGIAGCDTTQKKPAADADAALIDEDPFAESGEPIDDVERFARQVESATAPAPDAQANRGGEVMWDQPLGTVPERGRVASANGAAVDAAAITPAPTPAPLSPAPVAAAPATFDVIPASATDAELVAMLAERLKREGDAGQLRAHLARAALTLSDPQRELTGDDLAAISPDDRRLVLAYQRAFTQLARSMGKSSDEDRTQLQLAAEELAEQIGADRKLRLRNPQLCRKVSGFGQYDAFDRPVFLAGREQPVIVYAELDHFTAQPQNNGTYRVQLAQEITLYNESDGLAVWKVRPQQIVDHSANRRRDFFLVQIVRLPARLTVGKYQLKLTVTDELGQAVDETIIPVEIVADRQLATP